MIVELLYYIQNGRMLRNQVVRDSESGKCYVPEFIRSMVLYIILVMMVSGFHNDRKCKKIAVYLIIGAVRKCSSFFFAGY